MGQYYKPAILSRHNGIMHWWYSHNCTQLFESKHGNWFGGSGLKLMEHSWRKNPFVAQVMRFIENNPQRLVWAGDYAEAEKGRKRNVYQRCTEDKEMGIAGAQKVTDGGKTVMVAPDADMDLKYIINHTKREYVHLDSLPITDGWQIHALPLLTCEGNGQGGGDYWGKAERYDTSKIDKLVGSWARNRISSARSLQDIPKGYKAIFPQFEEE